MEIPVIIVTYNSAAHIAHCLQSVLGTEQVHGPMVTVVDNHSTDNTAALVQKEFPTVKLIANAENKGYARALNQVLKTLDTPHCLLLNPDTEWKTGMLAPLLLQLQQQTQAWCCGPAVTDAKGRFIRAYGHFPTPARVVFEQFFLHKIFRAYYQQHFVYDLQYANTKTPQLVPYISGAAMLIDVHKVKAAGYFDEDFFLYGEETELAWRMHQRGFVALLCAEASVTHHEGASIGKLGKAEQAALHRKGLLLYFNKTATPFNRLLVRMALSAGDLLRVLWRKNTLQLLRLNWSSLG